MECETVKKRESAGDAVIPLQKKIEMKQ